MEYIIIFFVFGLIFLLPIIFTIREAIMLFKAIKDPQNVISKHRDTYFLFDMAVFFAALFYSFVFLDYKGVKFQTPWTEAVYIGELHQPIFSGSFPTIFTIIMLSCIGYCTLTLINVKKTPPLIPVLSMSALFLGKILHIVFTLHVISFTDPIMDYLGLYLILPPLNFILMDLRLIRLTCYEYEPDPDRMSKIEGSRFLSRLLSLLYDSRKWPFIALILMLPLLGLTIGILILFGQAPNSIIKAFTDTADFRFSEKIPPQSLYRDEHYLCTVAAGGDKKVVKPLRFGIRHGHQVIVNRQLCVANAFEQILEEKTPRFHKAVRHFYDTYGFPIAKLINTKLAADIVYFIMKPLEWIFLLVLYLTDVHPEDRISMQYTGQKYMEGDYA